MAGIGWALEPESSRPHGAEWAELEQLEVIARRARASRREHVVREQFSSAPDGAVCPIAGAITAIVVVEQCNLAPRDQAIETVLTREARLSHRDVIEAGRKRVQRGRAYEGEDRHCSAPSHRQFQSHYPGSFSRILALLLLALSFFTRLAAAAADC